MAPTKSNHRRKSKTPKRVINDGELDNQDESATFLPQDPKALANLLQTRPKREFYESPTMPDMFYESIKQQRKDSQSEETAYTCWACKKKTYSSVSGLHYHVMNSCPQISILKFKCLICQEEFKAQDAMLEHLQDVHVKPYISESSLPKSGRTAAHAGRLKIQMFAESSEAAESLSASPDKDTEDFSEDFVYYQQEDDKCDEDVLPTKNFRGKQKRVRPSGGGPSDTYAAMDKPLADAFEWTYQFKKKLEESYLKNHLHFHSDFAHWEEIDTADLAETFNLTKTSPLFAINSDILNTIRKGKKPVTLKDKNNMNYKRLELFEALTTEQGGPMTFFVGGPVWAMSWCPYPNKSEQAQYLAIATHVGEHPLQPDVTYKEQSVIQLWNCGKLPVKSITTKLQSPSLAYGIALSSGPVWCLGWCPLVHKEPDPTVECEKLGLLAAACGSGDVRIFVMPKPSKKGIIKAGCKVKRAQLTSIPGLGNIYRVNPTILLKPARKRSFGQCLCFAWSPHGDCSVIVAGFASGFIAFWDINASSKLLTDKIGDVLILYPFSTYRAHSKAVRDVVWCPFNSNILVSTGADRFLKIWDRRKLDADIPHSLPPKMSIMNELYWSPLWCGVYAASDSVFSIPYHHGCCFLNLTSSVSQLQNVMPFKAASWTVSCNDWLNAAASGDVSGNAIVSISNNWNRSYIANKRYSRMLIFATEIDWKGKANPAFLSTEDRPDEKDSYKLIFYDTNFDVHLSKWKQMEAHARIRTFEDLADEPYTDLVCAVHKMRWNPNMSSFPWVATGTYSGLVRLHCISAMVSTDVEAAWRKCKRDEGT